MKGKLSIELGRYHLDGDEKESLGELLLAAAAITARLSGEEEERYARREAMWISRWAIKAVAREIIRTGKITLSLAVRFQSSVDSRDEGRDRGWWSAPNGRN